MIMPNKHLRVEESLLGRGAWLIGAIQSPMTPSQIWESIRSSGSDWAYEEFVLALVLLYAVGALEMNSGLITVSAQ